MKFPLRSGTVATPQGTFQPLKGTFVISVTLSPASLSFSGPGTKSTSAIVTVTDPSASAQVPVTVSYNGESGSGPLSLSYVSTETPVLDNVALASSIEAALGLAAGRVTVAINGSGPVKVSNTEWQFGITITVA